MVKEIRWSKDAIKGFDNVLSYLKENWTEKEVENFISQTVAAIDLIAIYPDIFRRYNKHDVRAALITKHNLLLYKVYNTDIDVLYFWDTLGRTRKNDGHFQFHIS